MTFVIIDESGDGRPVRATCDGPDCDRVILDDRQHPDWMALIPPERDEVRPLAHFCSWYCLRLYASMRP